MKGLKSITIKYTLILVWISLSGFMAHAQWTGPTTAPAGQQIGYSFSNGNVYTVPDWVISNGSIISSSSSGTTYSVTVQWTSVGAASLSFKNRSTIISTLSVTVCSPPSAPSTSFTYSNQCHPAAVIITRTGTPPGGETWYWQSSSDGPSGTNTSLGSGASIDVNLTLAGNYYIRAWSSCGWSASSTSTGTIPPRLESVTGASVCTGNSASLSAWATGATQYSWYDACTAGNLLYRGNGNFSTPALYSTTNYWVAVYNTGSGIDGPRWQVTATVLATPGTMTPAVSQSVLCGSGSVNLSASGAGTNEVYRWYTTPSGGSPLGSTTQSVSSTTTFYVAGYNTSTGCEGPRNSITVTVHAMPETPGVTGATFCGSGTVTATPGANANTIRWYDSPSGGTLLTTNTISPNTTTSTTYYITSYNTTTGCESSSRIAVPVTIYAIPDVPTASNTTICGSGTMNATPGANGNTVRWYNALTGGSLLATSTTSPSTSSTTTYYLSSYHTTTGCESTTARIPVTLTINAVPAAPTASSTTICGTGTINATPGANGNTVRWYNALTGGTLLATSTTSPSTSSTTTYYISSYHSGTGCESTAARLPVTLTINAVPATPSATSTSICGTGTMTATPGANGNSVRWYNALTGGSLLATSTTSPSTSSTTTYYLSSYHTTTGCESTAARIPVTLTINAVPAAPTASSTTICGTGTINATPGANGNTVRWYNALTGGTLLATSTTSPSTSSTTTYYISSYHSGTGCESTAARLPVTLTINAVPVAPSAVNTSICGTGTMTATPGANGNTVRWYNALTGGTLLATSTTSPSTSSTTTYYLSSYNTTTGCESTSARLAVTLTINPVPQITVTGATALVYGSPTTLSTTTTYSYQWKKDNVNINGATQSSFIGTGAGSFQVGVKANASAPECTSAPVVLTVNPQPFPVNSISTIRILKSGVTPATSLYTLNSSEVAQSIAYTDGLGRLFQSVAVGQSPLQTDIIAPVAFGNQGLTDTTFLPYVHTAKDGRFRPYAIRTSNNAYSNSEQFNFYQNTAQVATDSKPYARTVHRTTPDARVIEQGAPGVDWQPGTTHTVRTSLELNTTTYPVRYWKADGSTNSNYPTKSVTVAITTDENGNQVRTYTNQLGQTVLKQVQETSGNFLQTYTVYDNYGRVVFQIPPKAVLAIGPSAVFSVASNSTTDELVYKYVYDIKGRLVEKKVPGAAWVYMIYDKLDRLVLTQDGNLRVGNRWSFIKYDAYNRPVYTGIYTNSVQTTRATVQALFDAIDYSVPTNRFEVEQANATYHGYSNTTFPTAGLSLLTVAYYDHYDFDRNGTDDYTFDPAHLAGQETSRSTATRGLVTGSKRVLLDAAGNPTSSWLINVVFYGQYDRPIQTQSNNHLYLTVADKQTTIYDFVRVIKTKTTHASSATATVNLIDRPVHDHAGRITEVYRQIDTNPEQRVAAYTYNALGQVVDKKLHHTGGGNYLQSVDYRYNIRGWLSSINNAQLNVNSLNNDDANDYFGLELLYNLQESGLGNTQYYNGNISAIKWKGPGTTGVVDQRSYKYTYDKSDRLTAATFQAHTGATWTKEANTLNEVLTYDANGNINSLVRNQNQRGNSGITITSTPQAIDNLTYTYPATSNRMEKVEDAVALNIGLGDFKNTVNQTTEFTYNADGSLTADNNKGISSITYNILGKPQVINFTNGKKIEYIYDAVGSKVTVKTYQGTTLLTTTNYAGSFVYEGATPVLSFFSSPEGRVVKNGASYEYQYAITDHQGNTRVVFSSVTPAPEAKTANLEAATNTDFFNYTNRVGFNLFDHTDAGTTYTYAQKLTGGTNSQMGVAKSYKVYAGDKVKIEAWAKYQNPTSTSSNLSGFAGALLAAFGLPAPAVGEAGTASAALNNWGGLVVGGNGGTSTGPKAFVNIIVFDKNYKLLDAAWEAVDPAANQVGATPVVPHDYLMREYTAKEEGYVFMYVSNESATLVDVYFDDVVMTHTKGNIIQYNEYYPFGMQTATSWTRENVTGNNFLANGGTELNTNSQLYDLDYRNYDPVLGRMNGVDPMASKYASLTPYNFSFNDPVTFTDVSGADPFSREDYWTEINMQRRANNHYIHTIQTGNLNLGRFEGNLFDMTWGSKGFDHVGGLILGNQMIFDYYSMSNQEYFDRYAEKAELYEVWYDSKTLHGQVDSEFLGYRIRTIDGTLVWDNIAQQTQGGPNVYMEISNSFNETKNDFMLAENVGANALFNMIGHYSVHKGKDGRYYFLAGAAGTTPAKSQGDVTFQGTANLMVNGKQVSSTPFVYADGYNVKYPDGFSNLGGLSVQLPTSGTVMINMQFSYQIVFGSAGQNHSATLTVPVYIRTLGFPRD